MRTLLIRSAQGILLAGFIAASAWSMRLACADYWLRQETVPGTEKAIATTPGQATLYVRLAQLSEEDTQKATEALERAITLNPADSRSWIDLGLRHEANGIYGSAEHCLLRAAEEDNQYLPRWTLANYYFRRTDTAHFWVWAREAIATVHDDPMPLFQLCGRIAEDGNLIDRLQIDRPDVRASYVSYLMSQKRVDLIGGASHRLLERNRKADVPLLLRACDSLFESKRVDEALAIWNHLADTHQIPFERLARSGGTVLTNGNFTVQPTSQGFDWRLPEVAGVSVASEGNPGGLRITFSGQQPEKCEPLIQFVPVEERTEYVLRFRYHTSSIRPGAGLHWRITDVDGATLKEGEDLSSETEVQKETPLMTATGCRLLRLSVTYGRARGTTRMEGFVVLHNVELKAR